MGDISTELTKFKTSVEPNLDKMNTTCTDLSSKIQEISTSTKTAKSEFDTNYNSSNKASIVSRFEKIESVYNKISTSLEGDLKGILSDSKELIDLIKELENINTEIQTQQGIVNNNSGSDSNSLKKRNEAQRVITEKNNEFNRKHEEAKTKYESLKSKDAALSFVEEFSPNNAEANIEDLQYGTFELKEYTASNGLKVQYWVYKPDY
jgi:chromosome segregation ATPase